MGSVRKFVVVSLCLELGGKAAKAEAHLAVSIELSNLWNHRKAGNPFGMVNPFVALATKRVGRKVC